MRYKTKCLKDQVAIIHANFFFSFSDTSSPIKKKHHFYTNVTYIIIIPCTSDSHMIQNIKDNVTHTVQKSTQNKTIIFLDSVTLEAQ